jgi:hypothetical protein
MLPPSILLSLQILAFVFGHPFDVEVMKESEGLEFHIVRWIPLKAILYVILMMAQMFIVLFLIFWFDLR